MTDHQLWFDTLNMAQLQGKSLSEALTLADSNWPFKYVNGTQTTQSEALERDKRAHKPVQFDLSTFQESEF